MKLNFRYVAAIVFCLLNGSNLYAQGTSTGSWYFEETFFPVYKNENDTTTDTTNKAATESGLGYDFRTTIGYTFFGGSFLTGLTYNYYNLSTDRDNVEGIRSGLNEETSESKLGLTVGWLSGGFRALFTYFLSGEKTVDTKNFDNSGTTGHTRISNSDMTGYQMTLGYTFNVWRSLEIGPSLVYSATEYSKQTKRNYFNATENYTNLKLYSPYEKSQLSAMVSLIVRF